MRSLYLIFIISFNATTVLTSDEERNLISKLLENYNPSARPVVNETSQLNLEIILTLKQIINLDVRKQILKTKLWLEYYWKDKNLVWRPVSHIIIRDCQKLYDDIGNIIELNFFISLRCKFVLLSTFRRIMEILQVLESHQAGRYIYK